MYNLAIDKRIKDNFKDVVFYKFIVKDYKKYITLKTTTEWDENIARKFQINILHRHPYGFGGPFDFKCEKIEKNLFIVTWNCYNISD